MTVDLEQDGNGRLTLQISAWVKLAISILAACLAVGSAFMGHVVSVAHHDQSVDDAIARLNASVAEIRTEEAINTDARIRALVELQEVNRKLDRMIALENRGRPRR